MDSNVKVLTQPIDTPYLRVDKSKFINNISRLKNKMDVNGVILRPHLKTLRSAKATQYILSHKYSPATVSTLKEAEVLAEAGYCHFLYAVGISAGKLPRVKSLISRGVDLIIILDSVEQAKQVVSFSQAEGCRIPVLIELDCDGHRGGIRPDSLLLVEIAQLLRSGGADFRGLLTHAGGSYFCQSRQELVEAARQEVECVTQAVGLLAKAGVECTIVSVGSTPTAFAGEYYEGITEVRAGVYCFFDLMMTQLGVCKLDDIALSVVTTVIGHNADKGWLIIDAGWMALSSDPGIGNSDSGIGSKEETDTFGLVTDLNGHIVKGLRVILLNQEHGIVERESACIELTSFPIGSQIRILPNHACATASMHQKYHVVGDDNFVEIWERIQGW